MACALRPWRAAQAGIVINFRDVTERKTLEEKLATQALHDPLTGLANRLLLIDRVGLSLERVARQRQPSALLFIDLDNFKGINDSLGHELGDQMLQGVADRLRSTLRAVDTAARLGGDEFAVLLEETSESGAIQVASRIHAVLDSPLRAGDNEIYVSASIGICVSESGEETAAELLRNADLAMYVAKEKGKSTYAVFEPSMYSTTLEAMSLKTDLRKGLQEDEFVLHYQPVLNLETGAAEGFEALVRWNHPARGLLSPADFIPVAEESGLIVDMGKRLLYRACAQAQAWRKSFSPTLRLSFNLSAKQLQDVALLDSVGHALEATGLPSRNLVLEITENLLMQHVEATAAQLKSFRSAGIGVAIDDFGTGHSSLGLLRGLPIDIMKVDRTFVQGLADGSQDVAFVEAILRLAHSLRLETIAEGVETRQHAELLLQLGCRAAQGYLFAKPMDATDAELFLATCPAKQMLQWTSSKFRGV